jgi:hypothetical protein
MVECLPLRLYTPIPLRDHHTILQYHTRDTRVIGDSRDTRDTRDNKDRKDRKDSRDRDSRDRDSRDRNRRDSLLGPMRPWLLLLVDPGNHQLIRAHAVQGLGHTAAAPGDDEVGHLYAYVVVHQADLADRVVVAQALRQSFST